VFAKAKGIVIVACVLLCTLTLMGGRPNMPPRPGASPGPNPESVGDAVSVLVEAFVVEVNLPALAELGVSPIGAEPHAVSVADILKCLQSTQAQVICGSKGASHSDEQTAIQAKRTTYVRRETGTPSQVDFNPYDSGTHFSVSAAVVSETAVSVEFRFTHARFTQKTQAPDVPPETDSWEWSGSVILEPGKPQIVAATQDSETAVFLLLTAH
jgi:hypothetical protein